MSNEEEKNKEQFTRNAFVEDGVNIDEYVALQRELDELKKQEGTYQEGKIAHLISSFFERRDAREKVQVNKKKHLLLAIFLGWMGGHRFHAKQYLLGILYLATFWTCLPLAMTIVDILEIIPIPADENGNIMI